MYGPFEFMIFFFRILRKIKGSLIFFLIKQAYFIMYDMNMVYFFNFITNCTHLQCNWHNLIIQMAFIMFTLILICR